MALQDDILSRIDEILLTAVSDRAALSLLREAAQGYSAVRCDAEDLQDEEPFRAYPRCDLFCSTPATTVFASLRISPTLRGLSSRPSVTHRERANEDDHSGSERP